MYILIFLLIYFIVLIFDNMIKTNIIKMEQELIDPQEYGFNLN